ncbi:CoA-binding protein [Paeniglutamicibacter kerguelensis]|uniref:CoA-binding protein n=1 Tax=Paeniglutamicibacter kerguelensis TaxID=254788 RepID=A0ABS4XJT9_9MICC|nr:CoA-binding protein [Paeniglutamicibacter kerguelensis]MBP2388707.1 putative CoA-binding protein [Paeniglutamicibacter kerguelensis]
MSSIGSPRHENDPEVIRRLLTTPARWAVVGLSNNPLRVAPRVAHFLQTRLGMEIIPVSLRGDSVLGEPGYKTLGEIPGHVDVVDCFVNSQKVGAVVDQAIAIGASAVWLQLGVIDEEALARAKSAGLDVVMDTCPIIEYEYL